MALSAYSKYKKSNTAWINNIPEHWDELPLYAISKVKSVTGEKDRELLSVYLNQGVIRFSDVTAKRTNVTSEDLSKYQSVDPGDFVLNNQQAWRGSVGVSIYKGIVSPAYLILTLNSKIDLDYANKLFRERTMVSQYLINSKGVGSIQRNLYWPHLKRATTILPPMDEQKLIVRYLKFTNNKIQKYISAKKKLIKLVEEQKQAIIHQAVTGAIDVKTEKPYSEYKDSGVEWLGEIPIGWDVRRIKSLTSVKRGASPRPIADMKYFDNSGEYAWVRIADVTSNDRYLEHTKERLSELGKSLSVPLEPGSLFLSIAGSVGKPIITHIKCCIHDGFVYFPRFNGNPEYLYYIFASGSPYKGLGKMGTQLNLNTETVGSIAIGWPSPDIQGNIVKYLDIQLKIFNDLIFKAKSEINLIQEYRISLVSDVVTGKIDVREIAKLIPKEIEEIVVDQIDEEIEVDAAELDENGSN